jgi:hypothetical protein
VYRWCEDSDGDCVERCVEVSGFLLINLAAISEQSACSERFIFNVPILTCRSLQEQIPQFPSYNSTPNRPEKSGE